MLKLLNALGIVVLIGVLYLLSNNKKAVNKTMIVKALVIQESKLVESASILITDYCDKKYQT